jgi:hypothetical protein
VALLAEAERAALALLWRRGFEVVPQPDSRFKVERQVLSACEMVAKAHRMRAREAGTRAGQGGSTHRSAPAKVAGNGHESRLDDPATAALLERTCRALAELAAMVAALQERGVDPARLKETIGTALPVGLNVVHALRTIAADVERRPGEERREAAPPPHLATASARAANRLTQPRHKRRCSWWPPACRRPRRPAGSALGGPPSTARSGVPARSKAPK